MGGVEDLRWVCLMIGVSPKGEGVRGDPFKTKATQGSEEAEKQLRGKGFGAFLNQVIPWSPSAVLA